MLMNKMKTGGTVDSIVNASEQVIIKKPTEPTSRDEANELAAKPPGNHDTGLNNLLEFYPVGDSSSNAIPLMPGPPSSTFE